MPAAHSSIPYEQSRQFECLLGGRRVVYVSKKGLPDWDSVSPAVLLLGQVAELQPDWRVLLLGSGHGAFGVLLGLQVPRGEVWLSDTNFIAQSLSTQTIRANGVSHVSVLEGIPLPPGLEGQVDAVFVTLPKGRKLAQRRLIAARAALRMGGVLYLAGANADGIQPAIRDAEALLGQGVVLGYKKGNRAVRWVKGNAGQPLPDWAEAPGVGWGTWFEFEAVLAGQAWRLCSLPGVFSYDRLDEGSRLLLDRLEISPGEEVLDLGCGWGALGLAAGVLGAARVDLVDVDLQAVAAAARNLARLNLNSASALPSDVASEVSDRRYSLVVTNPPFHSGRAVDYEIARAFITQSHQVLTPSGRLLLVANRFIRYEIYLRELFRSVECIATTGKYQVWLARK